MSSTTKCHIYDIVDPDPFGVSSLDWSNIAEQMKARGWFGETGERYGFISVLSREEIVSGLFAHEGQKSGIQYDENKNPINAPSQSFEHIFFSIFTDTSQLVLQHKNIYGYDDLGLPTMRESLKEALTILFRLGGVSVTSRRIQIEPAGARYTQEELYEFFRENDVIRVEIKNLQFSQIPNVGASNYNLYNPKDDWNPITWGAVADTLQAGVKNVTFEADEKNYEAKLNKGPLPKAFSRIGEIEEIDVRDGKGTIVTRKKTTEQEISISIPPDNSIDHSLIDALLSVFDQEERVATWKKRMEQRRKDLYRGTLFDTDNK